MDSSARGVDLREPLRPGGVHLVDLIRALGGNLGDLCRRRGLKLLDLGVALSNHQIDLRGPGGGHQHDLRSPCGGDGRQLILYAFLNRRKRILCGRLRGLSRGGITGGVRFRVRGLRSGGLRGVPCGEEFRSQLLRRLIGGRRDADRALQHLAILLRQNHRAVDRIVDEVRIEAATVGEHHRLYVGHGRQDREPDPDRRSGRHRDRAARRHVLIVVQRDGIERVVDRRLGIPAVGRREDLDLRLVEDLEGESERPRRAVTHEGACASDLRGNRHWKTPSS